MNEVYLLYKAVHRNAEERAAGTAPSALVGVFSTEQLARIAQSDLVGQQRSWIEPWPIDEASS